MNTDKESVVAKEILSYCGKCKLALAHTIISMDKKGNVDRCECRTCGAAHKYRDPAKPVKPKTTAKRTPKKAAVAIEVIWKDAVSNAKGSSKPYMMSSEFSEGDLIEHPMFGLGIVGDFIGHNKIKVIFESSEKVLAQNRV
ncbi:MAG: hypothetical protein ABH871_08845 [Pseudomonadota bacterium]